MNNPTYRGALKKAIAQLVSHGWEQQTAFLEASLLLGKACDLDKIKLLTSLDEPLTDSCRRTYDDYLCRHLAHEPLQYILGRQTFMSLDFAVTPDVLIPRGETELLVQETIREARGMSCPAILDLCTGCGAIAVSLAHDLPAARITATDLSPAALDVARANAQTHGVAGRIQFLCGDMFSPLPPLQTYDIITCNPPYISAPEYRELPPDVRREPRLALCGGPDGLDYYRILGAQAGGYLFSGGKLLLEIGADQAAEVTQILRDNGFAGICVIKDWNGHNRIIIATTE